MATSSRRHRAMVVGIPVISIALVLALALGLGLKRHKSTTTSTTGTSTTGTSTTQSQLQSPPESNFVLPNITAQSPVTRFYNFTISQAQGAPDGFSRPMLVVNDMYPGPTIQANQVDRLVVIVQNNLPNATSIHWHGLFQNGTNYYDGTSGITECGIPPGQSLTYNFTFGEFSGTTWWHALSTQYTDGISGALIVHPTAPTPAGLPSWDQDLVTIMADWYHGSSADLLAQYLSLYGIQGTQGNEPVPDAGTLNGLGQYPAAGTGGSYFNFTLERNKMYRFRLCNAGSFAPIRFSVDAHPLTLIEADGTLLAPTAVAGVTLAVAQRASVLLHAAAPGNGTYWLRATVQSDMFMYALPGQNLDIRGVLRYADAPATGLPGDPASPDPGPGTVLPDVDGTTALVPLVRDPAPAATRAYGVSFGFERTDQGLFLGFVNDTSWAPLSGGDTTLLEVRKDPLGYAPEGAAVAGGGQFVVTEDAIQVVEVRVDNLDDGDHPFHLHGHRPWIVGSGPGRYVGQALNTTNPLRRDTVLIPAYSYLVLRFVADNPGVWAFHCHLAWHMAAGLLMQFSSLPSRAALLDVPQDIVDQCAAAAA